VNIASKSNLMKCPHCASPALRRFARLDDLPILGWYIFGLPFVSLPLLLASWWFHSVWLVALAAVSLLWFVGVPIWGGIFYWGGWRCRACGAEEMLR
tara:strand:- start:412 stop:702 length:291 start_codon:yes stop_codon:yes gene_type:complete